MKDESTRVNVPRVNVYVCGAEFNYVRTFGCDCVSGRWDVNDTFVDDDDDDDDYSR